MKASRAFENVSLCSGNLVDADTEARERCEKKHRSSDLDLRDLQRSTESAAKPQKSYCLLHNVHELLSHLPIDDK